MPETFIPSPTILLLNLPPGILCGINLLTFTTSPRFQGIKDLPPGFHFLYTSETTSLSIRNGFWFHIHDSPDDATAPLILQVWDSETSSLNSCSKASCLEYRSRLADLWTENLTPYRQSATPAGDAPAQEKNDWEDLTAHVTPQLLDRLTGSKEWRITTASCAAQDRDEIPGLSAEEAGGEEGELEVLGIDLKRTWREGAVGRERTEAAVDRSWALEDLVRRWAGDGDKWGDVIMGEMEVCFLMVLTVANFSCLEEWKRVLGLVLTCERAVRERQAWFAGVLTLLRKQLERGQDVEGGLFDMSDEGGGYLERLLKRFKRTVTQLFGNGEGEEVKVEMEALEDFLRAEYGWELGDDFLRRGMLELEDGEQVEMEVEEMQAEDERGEYAPVVVDLE